MRAEQQRITRFKGLAPLGILWTFKHVNELEKRGQFPRRVRLGPNSVGWVTTEIIEFVEERIRGRDATARKAGRKAETSPKATTPEPRSAA
jgi:prophage regulatory protein